MTDLASFHSRHLKLKPSAKCVQVTLSTPSIYEEEMIEQIGRDLNSLSDEFECHRLVLDIKSVNLITSSLIGKFVQLHKKLKNQGGVLVMCGVQGHLETIFRASNLLNFFQICPTLEKGTEFANNFVSHAET